MRLNLPLPLRRFLLGRLLLLPVTLASVSSGAEFVVDATRTTDPSGNVYGTLQELAASGVLAAGDTVTLYNDDSTLTAGLNVPVNFRSSDPAEKRIVDLSGLRNNAPLYSFAGTGASEINLEMESVVWQNAPSGVISNESNGVLVIGSKATFENSQALDTRQTSARYSYNYGGAIYSNSSITMEDDVRFSGNHAVARDVSSSGYAYGGAVYAANPAQVTIGDNATFTDNYASVNLTQPESFSTGSARGGAIHTHEGSISVGNNANFSDNHVASSGTSASEALGGAIHSNSGSVSVGNYAKFSNNYGISASTNNRSEASGGAIHSLGQEIVIGEHTTFTNNYVSAEKSGSSWILASAFGGAISGSNNGVLTIGAYAVFENNHASGELATGGAIYGFSSITIGDGVSFVDNYGSRTGTANTSGSGAVGGAIYSSGVGGEVVIGNDAVFSGNYVSSSSNGDIRGGAIYGRGTGKLTIGDNADFSGNYASSFSSHAIGGAISGFSTIAIGNNANFSGNFTSSTGNQANGGAIKGDGTITIGDNASFSGNYANSTRNFAMGGAIYGTGAITIGDNSSFSGNYVTTSSANYYVQGGAIYCNDGPITIGDNAKFTGNYAANSSPDENTTGGAIHCNNGAIAIGANANFIGNYVESSDGEANGGAISGFRSVTIGANAKFTGNYALSNIDSYYGGGAIYANGLTIKDGATFTNNYAGNSGGAISVRGGGGLYLYALTQDVLFSGNMTGGTFTRHGDGTFSVEEGVANAVFFSSGAAPTLEFAAAEGREVRFNDPVTGSTLPFGLELNRYTDEEGTAHEMDGTIVFNGELYQGEEAHLVASRYSNFVADTTLHGGALLLEHDVVFGRKLQEMQDTDTSSLTVEKGVLEITGGSTANAAAFTLSGPDAVLRPGGSSFINARTADLSRGFTFDMCHQLQAGPDYGPDLTLSASQSFTAGGLIGVVDTGDNASFFYADSSWKQDRSFHVLTDADHTREGDFDGAFSLATGSDRVDSPYSYTGTWSHQWVDADGDGYAEQLRLVWKADGDPISQIAPELVGELAYNSLWSSASNAASLGGNVLSRLNALRLTDKHARNLWGMGLGDFARQRSRGGVDGYDYNGGGYSVGVDSGLGGNSGIWGIAFGQLYGHAKSRDFQARNKQDTLMGSLYWGRLIEESERARWTFKGSLTWAETDNRMNSYQSGAPVSRGKWNNRTWLAQMEISRTADYAGGWKLSPFVRVEFTHGTQDSFRENGAYDREFNGAVLRRLSIPVGLEIGRTDEWKGRLWSQALRLSYVGDVLQDVPGGTVYSPYSDMSWRGRAVDPGRHAFRAGYDTILQCNKHWSVYAGYGLEVRGNSVYHQVNAGVSRSF